MCTPLVLTLSTVTREKQTAIYGIGLICFKKVYIVGNDANKHNE